MPFGVGAGPLGRFGRVILLPLVAGQRYRAKVTAIRSRRSFEAVSSFITASMYCMTPAARASVAMASDGFCGDLRCRSGVGRFMLNPLFSFKFYLRDDAGG